MEGGLRQEPEVPRRNGTYRWDVAWQWLPARDHLPPRYILYTKTGWVSLTHNPVVHQALARSLRESLVQFAVEDTWSSGERTSEENGSLNPLRMDTTTEAGSLLDNRPRLQNKTFLLVIGIAIVNPYARYDLENAARHVEKDPPDAVEQMRNKYRGSFPPTNSVLPFAMSMCDEAGSDVHALIKELAVGRVEHRSGIRSN